MGAQKLLMSVRGERMIDRVLAACRPFTVIVVASAEVARACTPCEATVIENPSPQLGMQHSLLLAHQVAPEDDALLVFLGDKPFVTAEIAHAVVAAAQEAGADVAFPERRGVGGHPVYFSERARRMMGRLAHAPLHTIRDNPELLRVGVPIEDDGAYFDIDDPGTLRLLNE